MRPTQIAAVCALLAAGLTSGGLTRVAGAAGAAAGAATVRGKVVGWEKLMPQVYADAAKSDARRYTWREPSPTVKQDFRKLSANVSRDVCVAAFATGGTTQPHDALAVKVTGGRLTPSTLVLSPGSRLSFKNADPFPHVLYEVGNDKWAANPVAPGGTREWSSTAPGVHVVKDELFPSIVMHIVIDPAAVEFALPDHEGAFAMPLAPGDYTLKAFFDGKQVGKEVAPHVGSGGLDMKEPMSVGGGESK